MGWSCGQLAGETLEKINRNFGAQGSSNSWNEDGNHYLFEVSKKEHRDGAITGSISREIPGTRKSDNSYMAVKVGSFRIEPDGKISRGPKAMKKAAGQ